jgi:hypothetical protein
MILEWGKAMAIADPQKQEQNLPYGHAAEDPVFHGQGAGEGSNLDLEEEVHS